MKAISARLLDARIRISNGLCALAYGFEDRGRPGLGQRVQDVRHAVDRAICGVLGHPRVIYGPMRDICLDCLTIVDEHSDGRGR